jgi:hypothetical protein
MDMLKIKEQVKSYTDLRNLAEFRNWKRKKVFPEVLDALLGKSDDHVVFAIDQDGRPQDREKETGLLAVKRQGFQYPQFFVDTDSAVVYCQFWR